MRTNLSGLGAAAQDLFAETPGKIVYTQLLTSCRLNNYLDEVDQQAQGITEQLKAEPL